MPVYNLTLDLTFDALLLLLLQYRGEACRGTVSDLREKRYRAHGKDCYLFALPPPHDTVVDATSCGSISRFTNHCCAPSLYTRVVEIDGESHVVFFTKGDVKAGQELTFDYRFKEEEVDRVPCRCGAPNCKGED